MFRIKKEKPPQPAEELWNDCSNLRARRKRKLERYDPPPNDEVVALLQNPDEYVRNIGLLVLCRKVDKQSIELALPLLKDSNAYIIQLDVVILRTLTDQQFTADQAGQWEKWWAENKTNFVVEPYPERWSPPLAR